MTVKIIGETKICEAEKKEMTQLHQDIQCLCDGISPRVVATILSNLTASIFIQNGISKEKFMGAMYEMYDVLNEINEEE